MEDRIVRRIARRNGGVFFRSDFIDLGSLGQVDRALRVLIQQGRVMKFGRGVYVRARPSVLDGKPTPTKGMRELATEVLARLGAEVAKIPRGTCLQFGPQRAGADRARGGDPRQAGAPQAGLSRRGPDP